MRATRRASRARGGARTKTCAKMAARFLSALFSRPLAQVGTSLFFPLAAIASLPTENDAGDGLWLLGRNSRKPKKANHGKRPCSHYRRHKKRPRKGMPFIKRW